jgi:prophage regulatory protein
MKKLIRLPKVKEKTAMCTTEIYKGMREGWFPKNIPIGKQARAWDDDEVNAWILAKIAAARKTEAA